MFSTTALPKKGKWIILKEITNIYLISACCGSVGSLLLGGGGGGGGWQDCNIEPVKQNNLCKIAIFSLSIRLNMCFN